MPAQLSVRQTVLSLDEDDDEIISDSGEDGGNEALVDFQKYGGGEALSDEKKGEALGTGSTCSFGSSTPLPSPSPIKGGEAHRVADVALAVSKRDSGNDRPAGKKKKNSKKAVSIDALDCNTGHVQAPGGEKYLQTSDCERKRQVAKSWTEDILDLENQVTLILNGWREDFRDKVNRLEVDLKAAVKTNIPQQARNAPNSFNVQQRLARSIFDDAPTKQVSNFSISSYSDQPSTITDQQTAKILSHRMKALTKKGTVELCKAVDMANHEELARDKLRKNLFDVMHYFIQERVETEEAEEGKRKKERTQLFLDAASGAVILLNTVFIGVLADHEESAPWLVFFDYTLSCVFLCELFSMMYKLGPSEYFSSDRKWLHIFDCIVVFFDVLSFLVFLLTKRKSNEISWLAALRVVRLLRLIRFLEHFNPGQNLTVNKLLKGFIDGLPALSWSFVLFFAIIYVVGLACRLVFGFESQDTQKEIVRQYFDGVYRSIYTVFRCSFGDCSTLQGTPIFEHVAVAYGDGMTIVYSMFIFVLAIGLFNVITSIFVDSVAEATNEKNRVVLSHRLRDASLFRTWSAIFVARILKVLQQITVKGLSGEFKKFNGQYEQEHKEETIASRYYKLRHAEDVGDVAYVYRVAGSGHWCIGPELPDSDDHDVVIWAMSKDNGPRPPENTWNYTEAFKQRVSRFSSVSPLVIDIYDYVPADGEDGEDWEHMTENKLRSEAQETINDFLNSGAAEEMEPLTTYDFERIIEDPAAKLALRALDINEADDQYLSDMLDPENDHEIPLENIVDGLKRLRGRPTRGDIITIDLMLRDVQRKLSAILGGLQLNHVI